MFTSERLHSELKHGGVRAPVIVVVVEGYCFLININVDPPEARPPRIPCIKRMIFQKMLFLSR